MCGQFNTFYKFIKIWSLWLILWGLGKGEVCLHRAVVLNPFGFYLHRWLDAPLHESSVSDFLISFSYSIRLLKTAVAGWFSARLSCSGCWFMGMNMIMVMINIRVHWLSFWVCSQEKQVMLTKHVFLDWFLKIEYRRPQKLTLEVRSELKENQKWTRCEPDVNQKLT